MSDTKLGSDMILNDGDFVVDRYGDCFTTDDYDNANSNEMLFPGYYNVVFALMDRLDTQKRSVPLHPEYGSNLPTILSNPSNPTFIETIRTEVSNVLLEDQRVTKVENVDVVVSGNKVYIKASVVLVDSTQAVGLVFPNFVVG